MFKFLYRFSFFRYVSTLSYPGGKTNGVEQIVALASCFGCMIPLYLINSINVVMYGGIAIFLWMGLLGVCAFMYAGIKASAPSAASLQPLSLKRKILYEYLFPVYASIASAFILLLYFALIVAISAIISVINGNSGGSTSEEVIEAATQSNYMGVHGSIAYFCICLSYYFAGMRAVYTPKKKTRIIYEIAYFAGMIILTVITTALAEAKYLDSAIFGEECYAATNVPWLFSAIWIVLTLCIFADMILQTVRYVRRYRRL